MKWIGQHIYDYIAKFRNDVYLESLSTTTETNVLVVDSNGKVSKTTAITGDITSIELVPYTGIDITSVTGGDGGDYQATIGVDVSDFMTNGANNYVVTATSTDAMNAEANLTFDGSILNLTGVMDISPANDAGAAALTIDNDDTNQIALDIAAANIDADVINISADAVTTANVIDISCDALTTGSALKIEDDSSATGVGGARNIVDIYQKNTSADVAQALQVKSNGGQIAVLIDKNASGTAAQNAKGLQVDFDRTVAGSGTAAHNDIGIDVDVNSASLGTSSLTGIDIDVVGATSGTSTAYGLDIDVSGADANVGIMCTTEGSTGFTHKNTKTSSATQGGSISLVSNDGAAMGDDHRLGALNFRGFDGSGDPPIGASIEAFADAAWSTTENGGRLVFSTTDGDDTQSTVLTLDSDKLATFAGQGQMYRRLNITNTTTSSATEGGILNLISNDGAAMGDDHQLGRVTFQAAEDGSSTLKQGASIAAYADAAWSDTENGTRLEFYTMDGNNTAEKSLTLDSDLLATFAGAVTVTGALTGTLATVSQPNVTTLAGVTAIGTASNNLVITNDQVNFDSTNANDPLVIIKNTADDATSGRLRFLSARGADGQDDDEVGIIQFFGYDDGTPSGEEYATIKGTIHDATSGQESGKLQLQVASHDGGSEDGLVLTGGSVDAEVDVTIGNGAASVVTIPGHVDLAGDIDVDGTLETDALTVNGVAFTPSTTKQLTYHMFKGDIDTTKYYVGLQEADSEQTSVNKNLPFTAPFAGKLLKVFLRSTGNLSGKTLTWRLETLSTSSTTGTSPSVVGTQSGAGCTTSSMTTYDFTSSLDSGDNIIDAGDMVHLSIQSNTTTPNVTYNITCLWEWDLS